MTRRSIIQRNTAAQHGLMDDPFDELFKLLTNICRKSAFDSTLFRSFSITFLLIRHDGTRASKRRGRLNIVRVQCNTAYDWIGDCSGNKRNGSGVGCDIQTPAGYICLLLFT